MQNIIVNANNFSSVNHNRKFTDKTPVCKPNAQLHSKRWHELHSH